MRIGPVDSKKHALKSVLLLYLLAAVACRWWHHNYTNVCGSYTSKTVWNCTNQKNNVFRILQYDFELLIEKCVLDAFISFRIRKIAEIENASKFRVGNRMVSPFSVRLIVFRSQHLHPLRAVQHIQILTRPTIAGHALSGSAFLDSTDGANSQKPVTFYYVFAYSHCQHIIFHHYVLTPPISFG